MIRICGVCKKEYNVPIQSSCEGVYVCQDCSERSLAKIQKRKPRYIYNKGGYATVIVNAACRKDGNNEI